MTCQPQFRIATFLHKCDAEHIHADEQRETDYTNAEVDLIHGDLGETALFSACDSRDPPLTRSLLSDIGPFCSRNDPKGSWEKVDGRYASGLFLQLPVRGCGSAATLGTQPFNYCYLRTTTEAMARLYRVIVRREDRIPQSEWSDYT